MKNIIVILTDTFRYDNLGDRAVRPVHTPELDRFATERATSVEHFYMNSFPTIPHRTDFATGVLGWPHYGWQSIDLSSPNHISRILSQQGFATQLICDCPHLFSARFNSGFDAAFQHRGQEGDLPVLHLNDKIQEIVPLQKTRSHPSFNGHTLPNKHRWTNRYYELESETFSAKTSETVVQFLEENNRYNPFFLWVDFFDPHEPWDPPEYMVRRYDPHYDGPPMLHPNYGHSSSYTEAELRNLWAHYAAEAELVDRHIGRVLQKIDDLQLWENSVVVVMADHGISIGEHYRTGKSNIDPNDKRFWPIYPEIGHVPFLIAGAGIPKNKSLDLIAQPIDLLPTLCDLAGVTPVLPQEIDGISFANQIRNSLHQHRDIAISGCHIKSSGSKPERATTPFLITKEWGYAPVGEMGTPELYDLKNDPLATDNVAPNGLEIISELHQLFLDHLSNHNAPTDFINLWKLNDQASNGSWATDYED